MYVHVLRCTLDILTYMYACTYVRTYMYMSYVYTVELLIKDTLQISHEDISARF